MGKTKTSSELEEYVAQTIVDRFVDPTTKEAVVACLGLQERSRVGSNPKRVWRYHQDELVAGNPRMLERALGPDQSVWPSLTIIFTIEAETSGQATIDVETYYDRGISEVSRGGHAQKWELEKQSGEWTVVKTQGYRFWD